MHNLQTDHSSVNTVRSTYRINKNGTIAERTPVLEDNDNPNAILLPIISSKWQSLLRDPALFEHHLELELTGICC
jgi:hypothetical protein